MWSPYSFKNFEMLQQGVYCDINRYNHEVEKLKEMVPLVCNSHIDLLKEELKEVDKGNKFILQIGDCAELFSEMTPQKVASKLSFYSIVSNVLASVIGKEVITIGRIAGQFAKPRSCEWEIFNGSWILNKLDKICSYKGDLINDRDVENRMGEPQRLSIGYSKSKETLKEISAFLSNNEVPLEESLSPSDFPPLSKHLSPNVYTKAKSFFTSHEGLHLDYESALTRQVNGKYYVQSADMLWIGNRTRNLPGAHIEFFRNIENVVGMKVDSSLSVGEFVELIKTLNPQNQASKLIIITRFGSNKVSPMLQQFVEAKQANALNFLWMVDPMHGNTYSSTYSLKTRDFSSIAQEIVEVAGVLADNGEKLSGIHLEASCDEVTEVTGGMKGNVEAESLPLNYTTGCDPRLNFSQTFDLLSVLTSHASKFKCN